MSGIFRAYHDRNTYARVAGCVMVLSALAAIPNSPPVHADTNTTAYVLAAGIYPGPGLPVGVTPVPRIKENRRPIMYSVRSGDTLTSIAARTCRNPKDWTGIWRASHIANPDLIYPGERLRISCTSPRVSWNPSVAVSSPGPTPTTASAPASGGYSGGGSFQQCVIARESGGNSQAMNASGHYGLYQFSLSTWVAAGGNPADFGNASASEQNAVFQSAYAMWGSSPWSPYDGC